MTESTSSTPQRFHADTIHRSWRTRGTKVYESGLSIMAATYVLMILGQLGPSIPDFAPDWPSIPTAVEAGLWALYGVSAGIALFGFCLEFTRALLIDGVIEVDNSSQSLTITARGAFLYRPGPLTIPIQTIQHLYYPSVGSETDCLHLQSQNGSWSFRMGRQTAEALARCLQQPLHSHEHNRRIKTQDQTIHAWSGWALYAILGLAAPVLLGAFQANTIWPETLPNWVGIAGLLFVAAFRHIKWLVDNANHYLILGEDGVRMSRSTPSFVSYQDIEDTTLERNTFRTQLSTLFFLIKGERHRAGTFFSTETTKASPVHETLRWYLEHHRTRAAETSTPRVIPGLLKQGRTDGAWRASLRDLVRGAVGYREQGVSPEHLADLAAHPFVEPEQRLGAAIALTSAGLPTTPDILRQALRNTVNPSLQVEFKALLKKAKRIKPTTPQPPNIDA